MKDLMAGIIVGIVALPLAIAFGIASGVSPEKGIITAIVAGFIISLLGGTKVQIGGPTGAFIVIIYGIVNNPEYGVQGLLIATILAGVMLVALGVCKMGAVIKFIPYPIIIGFTAGIALTIFTTQMGDVLGLTQEATTQAGEIVRVPLKTPGDFVGKWIAYAQNINTFNLWNFIVAIGSLLVIIFSPKALAKVPVLNKIPGSLYGILIGTGAVLLIKQLMPEVQIDTIGDRFHIQAQLPAMVVPEFTMETVTNLMPIAFTIAILGAIESLLSAAVADGVISDRHDSNTELIAQGVANIVSPLFGGIPATGAIARTAANGKNGGRTPVAGMVHSVVVLIILCVLMPKASLIPMPTIAAILFVVAYNMCGWRNIRNTIKTAPKSDIAVLFVTLIFTVIFDLVVAIGVGLVLAALLFMKRMADVTEGREWVDIDDEESDPDNILLKKIPDNTRVYEINGPMFFAATDKFRYVLDDKNIDVLCIRMRNVPAIDASGVEMLMNVVKRCERHNIKVVFSHVNEQPMKAMEKAGFVKHVGKENFCDHIDTALIRAAEIEKKVSAEKNKK